MDEDFNDFNSWDCGGAACMLAAVPAVFYFVFGGHDYVGSAILAGGALVVGIFVFIVAHLTGSRLVGRLLQVIGILLCIAYWAYAIRMWSQNDRFSPPDPAAVQDSPSQQ